MKRFFTGLFLIFLPLSVFAVPFNLKMGMNVNEIEKAGKLSVKHFYGNMYICESHISKDFYSVYAFYIDEKAGLYRFEMASDFVTTDQYGKRLKNNFKKERNSIARRYGKSVLTDTVTSSLPALDRNGSSWFSIFEVGDKTFKAEWNNEKTAAENIRSLTLECLPSYSSFYDWGFFYTVYTFENALRVKSTEENDIPLKDFVDS